MYAYKNGRRCRSYKTCKSVTRQKLDATEEQLYWFDQADEIAMNKEIDGALFKSLSLRRNATISPDVAANNVDVTPETLLKIHQNSIIL